jgi:glycosyltransferase involved in cell wall biosynthesis
MRAKVPTKPTKVTVIIPTMAAADRSHMLVRAIKSVRKSSSNPVKILTIVNGNRYDPCLLKWLHGQNDVHCHYQAKPSLPDAINAGRSLVTSEFFSTLDDDDEYLVGATDVKLIHMDESDAIDVVITNGFRMVSGVDTLCYQDLSKVKSNPLFELMDLPWLNSANALYRSSSISCRYFENYHPYAEWTWLAFCLSLDKKRIQSIDTPTFRIHDTVGSLSKTVAYGAAYESLFERMLARNPSKSVEKAIHRKLGAIYHQFSDDSLKSRNYFQAVQWHLRSLAKPGGLQYWSYSRHFLPLKHTER